jgi:hypothetical protein
MGERHSLVFLKLPSLKSRYPGALDALPHHCFGTAPSCVPTIGALHAHILRMHPYCTT